jgi:hypothetical protein
MASDGFNRFLKQLNASGREKGEGFDSSHFEGFSDDERQKAAQLLRDALLNGDNTAAHGLVLLDPETARPILDESLRKFSGDDWYSLRVVKELWKLTGETRYQDLMIAILDQPDELLRQSALVGLQATPHNARVMTALERIVLNDPIETLRFLAARQLLYGLGLIKDSGDVEHSYIRTARELSDNNRDVREKALSELKNRHQPKRSN